MAVALLLDEAEIATACLGKTGRIAIALLPDVAILDATEERIDPQAVEKSAASRELPGSMLNEIRPPA